MVDDLCVDVEVHILDIVLVVDRIVVSELLVDNFWRFFISKKFEVKIVLFLILSVSFDFWSTDIVGFVETVGNRHSDEAQNSD